MVMNVLNRRRLFAASYGMAVRESAQPSACNPRRGSSSMSSFVTNGNGRQVRPVVFMNRPTPILAASEPAIGWRWLRLSAGQAPL